MNTENRHGSDQIPSEQYLQPLMYKREGEIDLFEFILSIFSQWKLIGTITIVGTFLTIIYALMLTKEYEVVSQVATPVQADIKALNTRGYEQYTPEQIFVSFFDLLRSAEHLGEYIEEGGWYKKLFPKQVDNVSKDKLFANIYSRFETGIVRNFDIKNENVEYSTPNLVSIKMVGSNEQGLVELVNGYILFTNMKALKQIEQNGKNSVALEIEQLKQNIDELRTDAKLKRKLFISKLEEENKEKIAILEEEKKLLLIKAKVDKESKIASLKEAFEIAKKLGIKKLTTIDALATENKPANTMVSLGAKDNKINALMGTIYLNSKLEALKNRTNEELFLPRISEIYMEIGALKLNKAVASLKMRTSDDPYIEALPDLLKQIDRLKRLNFDFSLVKLYRLDQSAFVDGVPEKPNRKLIVIVGFVLSGLVGLLVVLFIRGRESHKYQQADKK